MRELLAKQRRLATGSEQCVPQPRPTVQMSKDEILGLREACTDEEARPTVEAVAEEARPAAEPPHVAVAEEARPATAEEPPLHAVPDSDEVRASRRTDVGIAPLQWRRPATVVRRPPSAFLIVAVLAVAGLLSLAAALLVLR
jgi:hypothetical protein